MLSLTSALNAASGQPPDVSASWYTNRSRATACRAESAWIMVHPVTPDDTVSSSGNASALPELLSHVGSDRSECPWPPRLPVGGNRLPDGGSYGVWSVGAESQSKVGHRAGGWGHMRRRARARVLQDLPRICASRETVRGVVQAAALWWSGN